MPYQKDNPELRLFNDKHQEMGIDDIFGPLVQPYLQANAGSTPPPAQNNGSQNNGASGGEKISHDASGLMHKARQDYFRDQGEGQIQGY